MYVPWVCILIKTQIQILIHTNFRDHLGVWYLHITTDLGLEERTGLNNKDTYFHKGSPPIYYTLIDNR